MSQKKIWSYTLPSACVLIFLFQNCSGSGFDVMKPALTSNFASSAPGADPGSSPGSDPTAPAAPSTPPTGNLPPDPSDAGRRILKVCPSGCTYALPSDALAVAMDNDIIEVAGADYNDCINVNQNGVKLRGANGRAHLTGKICGGKGELNNNGRNTVIESFEFSGMANADNNGAGVRHQGVGLTIRNCYFHDGQEGILSNAPSPNTSDDIVLVENSKFERLGGGGGYAHAVYFGHHRQIVIKNSLFLSSKDQGHEYKSRAQDNQINCSIFATLNGLDSYTVNFPEAGNVSITNSVIEQGPGTSNSNAIDYGSELGGTPTWTLNQFNLTNVGIINDRSDGNFFQVKNSTQFTVNDSYIVGAGSLASNQQPVLSNTKTFPSRSAASIGPFPNLPTPAGCGNIGLSF